MYELAVRQAIDSEDKRKATKNIVSSYLKLSHKTQQELTSHNLLDKEKKTLTDMNIYYDKQVFSSMVEQIGYGRGEDLRREVIERGLSVLRDVDYFLSQSVPMAISDRITYFLDFKKILSKASVELCSYIDSILSKLFLKQGVVLYENKALVPASSSCNQSVFFGIQCLTNKKNLTHYSMSHVIEEIEDTINSANFFIVRISSYLQVIHGDTCRDKAVFEEEEFDMDLIKDSLDYYRHALMLATSFKYQEGLHSHSSNQTFSVDIELEAICYSKLAHIYYNILKNSFLGEQYSKMSVDLAVTLMPRNLESEEWYRTSSSILQQIRKKREEEEESEKYQKAQKIIQANPTIFDKINSEFTKSIESFMSFVVKTYPPYKDFEFNVDEKCKTGKLSRVLVTLMAKYHPDKITEKDEVKKVIFEEIFKKLSAKLNLFKG
eukprot:CAMPEP_0170521790 /NCGR_PEP_ID=MMETSP0209-20121228/7165_1 /TAXON_ID=665100 ORGANISM="Litonotus pictus, Strain P1" /NCGR_SAMPLE_ID=MMETSP0209 /ASSEMBLY_ACC=CAM_ASM_000301 /LENGTH=434 /DNA_ID=CAMNT_0010808867 /DNA_START=72 /DNA_END=1376 /DNA_ORIENTATION=+